MKLRDQRDRINLREKEPFINDVTLFLDNLTTPTPCHISHISIKVCGHTSFTPSLPLVIVSKTASFFKA